MQILNNPSKVVFQKPLNFSNEIQERNKSRSSSIRIQKPHPNVIFDVHVHKESQIKNNNDQLIRIPKKVSFHYSNSKQASVDLNYPPNQHHHKIFQSTSQQKRRISEYSKRSNQQNHISIRNRINSTDQRSNISKDSNRQTLKASDFYVTNANGNQLNYPPNKIIKQQTNLHYQQDFPRERSRSSISSKSSTKLIVQTVRQVNPDGTKGEPVQIKHRIETEYLTNLNNNNRQNYHIEENKNLPKHIIVNHNYHRPQQIRNFYSPQNYKSINQHINDFTNKQFVINQSTTQAKQSTAQKAKYSEVFTYPFRNSGEQNIFTNKKQTQQSNYKAMHQEFKKFPITSQSKFQQNSIKDRFSQKIQQQHQPRQVQNIIFQDSFPNQFSNSNSNQNYVKETVYRGYGADVTRNILIQKPVYRQHRSKKYQLTSQMYSISQRLIDEIFRNETQKAVLKLNTIEYVSPRKYHSPQIRTYKSYQSTQKKGYIRSNKDADRIVMDQRARQSFGQEMNQTRNMNSQQTLKV